MIGMLFILLWIYPAVTISDAAFEMFLSFHIWDSWITCSLFVRSKAIFMERIHVKKTEIHFFLSILLETKLAHWSGLHAKREFY